MILGQMNGMRTVIVTGGAGFIGSNLVRMLVAETDWQVINLDALTYAGRLDSLDGIMNHPRHHFVHGDINDEELVKKLLEKFDPQAVIHLAAETHVDRSIDGAGPFLRSNICGTYALLNSMLSWWRGLGDERKRAFRFVHVSTDEVHGSLTKDDPPFTETTRYAPRSPYAATKAASDHLVRAWYHTYGFPGMVSHCSNNFGPRQFPEKLIPLAILKMLHGESIPLYGDGRHVRDWLHVVDHCRALLKMLENGSAGETYLVGSGVETCNRDLLDQLCAAMDVMHPRDDGKPHASAIVHVADRPGHDERYAIDASEVMRKLDWQPQVSLADGLAATIEWYVENRTWWGKILAGEDALQRRGCSSD